MKKIIFIFVVQMLFSATIKAQGSQGVLFDKTYLNAVRSNGSEFLDASYLLDNVYTPSATTGSSVQNQSNSQWVQVNTKCIRKISGIKIFPSLSTNCYVFISKAPFWHINIEALIRDPWVTYYNYTGGDGNSGGSNSGSTSSYLPVQNVWGQFVLIISSNGQPLLNVTEIDFYGQFADCGPYSPPNNPPVIGPKILLPYGTCGPWNWPDNPPSFPPDIIGPPFTWVPPFIGPDVIGVGPWWSSNELCGDGIDNDNNGLTDCEDYPCGVGTFNIVPKNPTCPICSNGELCIYANSNVKSVSIDNGITWFPFPATGFYCFTQLNDGDYRVKLRTEFGCEDGKVAGLISPTGEREICENGGFESGTFNNWTGGIASGYNVPFSNTSLVLNSRHTILPSSFVDPYAQFITGINGSYTAKLGNTNVGYESERLTYCFTVDNDNKDFSFKYATVLNEPNHGGPPYFKYKIYNKTSGLTIVEKITDTEDPYLTDISSTIKALGWQCLNVDLSHYVNTEVCAEFVSSDCGGGCHFGYGYVDGLCEESHKPIDISLLANEVYCGNQAIKITTAGVGYNEFQWIISKIDNNGNDSDLFKSNFTIGFEASIENLKTYYEENSNFVLLCGQKYRVQLNVSSGCGIGSDEIVLEYLCPEYDVDYCDPYYYCISNNQNQLPVTGVNNCDNCTYTWTSPQGLIGMINNTFKFPTLDRNNAYNAFEKDYFVVVRTDEGCIYNDKFSAINYGYEIEINTEIGYCSYDLFGSIVFDFPIDNNKLLVKAINIIDNSEFIVDVTGYGLIKEFRFNVLRDRQTRYKIEVSFIGGNINCYGQTCTKSKLMSEVIGVPWHSQWKSTGPNILSPNGDGNSDEFFYSFVSLKDNAINCRDYNFTRTSIYYYRLEIFDRWGNLFFDSFVSLPLTDLYGINGTELKWDGKVNGQVVAQGVYVAKATIHSCYDGSPYCDDCGGYGNPFQHCAEGPIQIVKTDFTIIY